MTWDRRETADRQRGSVCPTARPRLHVNKTRPPASKRGASDRGSIDMTGSRIWVNVAGELDGMDVSTSSTWAGRDGMG